MELNFLHYVQPHIFFVMSYHMTLMDHMVHINPNSNPNPNPNPDPNPNPNSYPNSNPNSNPNYAPG